MVTSLTLFDLIAVGLTIWILRRSLSGGSSKRLPPGPKPWPIIGNVLDVPSEQAWKTYAQWSERWGNIRFPFLSSLHTLTRRQQGTSFPSMSSANL